MRFVFFVIPFPEQTSSPLDTVLTSYTAANFIFRNFDIKWCRFVFSDSNKRSQSDISCWKRCCFSKNSCWFRYGSYWSCYYHYGTFFHFICLWFFFIALLFKEMVKLFSFSHRIIEISFLVKILYLVDGRSKCYLFKIWAKNKQLLFYYENILNYFCALFWKKSHSF